MPSPILRHLISKLNLFSSEIKSIFLAIASIVEPEPEIANAALFLASEKANFITGQVLSVNGGIVI